MESVREAGIALANPYRNDDVDDEIEATAEATRRLEEKPANWVLLSAAYLCVERLKIRAKHIYS